MVTNYRILFLFPSDYFDLKKVDEEYRAEYDTALKFSEFGLMLFNYDEFVISGKLRFYPANINSADYSICVYRGWMLKPDRYTVLYNKLKSMGITLINSPDEYANLHLFPNVYGNIMDFTPRAFGTKTLQTLTGVR